MARRQTPGGHIRAHHAKIVRPPGPAVADRKSAVRALTLNAAGRELRIGGNLEGDPQSQAQMDGTATVTLPVRDTDMALQDALADEQVILTGGVRTTINGIVFVLQSVEVDDSGTLVTLTCEDEVSWRLKQFSRFFKQDRRRGNRAHFVWRMVREASSPPMARMGFYCPEVDDRQQIARGQHPKPKTTKHIGGAPRTGSLNRAFPEHTISDASGHVRLSAAQVVGIGEAVGLRHRAAVKLAKIAKGESSYYPGVVGHDPGGTRGYGLLQITTPPANGPDLVRKVKSLGGFGQMLNPVKNLMVAKWLFDRRGLTPWVPATRQLASQGGDIKAAAVGGGRVTTTTTRRSVTEPYEYTRGSRGRRESSWEAIARLAGEVGWHYWAQDNTLVFVSGEELRASPPAVEVNGNEPWVVAPPSWEWAPNRPVTEVTLKVLADRWAVQCGAAVLLDTPGPANGVFLVKSVSGSMVAPEVTVTLDRPARAKPEPANETRTVTHTSREASAATVGGVSAPARGLLAACEQITAQRHPYSLGGGHGPLRSVTAHGALDCSGAVSLVLWKAGLFNGTSGITSTGFESWGKPGRGREFTVWTNPTHVFIIFENGAGGRWQRFGTSPHGCGWTGGAALRTCSRSTAGFVARHAPGH